MTVSQKHNTAAARQTWRQDWRWIGMLLAGLAALSSWGHWTWRLDEIIYDAGQSTWTRPAPDDIVIVAIDDASLQAIGRWPWRRAIHAQALQLINQAKPRSVLFNLLMTEPDRDSSQDRLLADAIEQSGRVVLPVGHALDNLEQGHELLPIESLRRHAHLAHADVSLDMDGVQRFAWLEAGTSARLYPHPSLALMQMGSGQGLDVAANAVVPQGAPRSLDETANAPGQTGWRRTNRVAIRYLGPTGRIKQVSFAALLRGDVPVSALRGHDVLVGVTARGLADVFLTPVSGLSSGMSGVEVTAQFLASLRSADTIYTVPRVAQAALAAVLIMGLMWSFRRITPRQALFTALNLSVASVLVSWLLMGINVWWSPFSVVLMALLAYPLWSWRRLEATAHSLEEELRALAGSAPGVDSHLPRRGEPGRDNDFMGQRTEALHQASAQLREARQLLADTLAALPDAVFVMDAQGLITQANLQACQVSGFVDPQNLVGQPLHQVLEPLTPTEAPNWPLLFERVQNEKAVISTEASHQRGNQYLVHLAAASASDVIQRLDTTAASGVIVCVTDVSALRQAELQRQELMGFIAHDIRSPQASLIALVELQRMGDGLPQTEALEHIDMLARSTLDLCEELLQVMRAETRPVTLKRTDLYSLGEECMDAVQLQAQRRHITLGGNWSGETRLNALVDDYLLHRAVVNLLNNAVKFSPDHGSVRMVIETRDAFHVIAVQDEGPGIPESELGRLFRRYERAEQGRPSKLAAGIGLGLVFIETVARRHGGKVSVSTTPGVGSCFELWVPVALPDNDTIATTTLRH